jgi:carbamoyl-phosphate synthase/aspartate carbamoyltransferase
LSRSGDGDISAKRHGEGLAVKNNLMSLSVAPREVSPIRSLSSLQHTAAFSRRHILSVKQFGRDDLHVLFNLASEMRNQVEKTGSVGSRR